MYECILCIINRPGTVNALIFWLELEEPRLPSAGLLGAPHQAGHCQRLNESGHSPHAPTSERTSKYMQYTVQYLMRNIDHANSYYSGAGEWARE